ncbi:MAG: hypothetical protein GY937_14155 [bacterium]|nr:hypothetical protein [bacterium]
MRVHLFVLWVVFFTLSLPSDRAEAFAEFFLEGSILSVNAGAPATVTKLDSLFFSPGMELFGHSHWDLAALDLEPGNPNLGRYAGSGWNWGFDVLFPGGPYFTTLEIQVANDLAAGGGGIFDAGGDGFSFLATPPLATGMNLPPWLQWTQLQLVLSDPSGQALSDISSPTGFPPPDVSQFANVSFLIEGFDLVESQAFTIVGQVDLLRIPEAPLNTLLLLVVLAGWGARNRRALGPRF